MEIPAKSSTTYLHEYGLIDPESGNSFVDDSSMSSSSTSKASNSSNTVIEWNHHGEFLSNAMSDFFRRGYQVDTSVTFGGERLIGVHRLLMAAFLPTFRKAVDTSVDGPLSELNLDCVAKSIEDVRALLEFVYTGRATVSDHRLDQLSRLAKDLCFEGLSDAISVHCRTTSRTSNIDSEPDQEPIMGLVAVKEEPYDTEETCDAEDTSSELLDQQEQLDQLKSNEIVVKIEPADYQKESSCSSDDENSHAPDPVAPDPPMIPADLCSVIINAESKPGSGSTNNSCTLCCELCGMKFNSMWDVRIHFQSSHPNDKLYECKKCNFHAITELGMYSHVVTAHKSVATAASGKLVCDKCNKEFTLRSSLLRHLTNVHDIRKPYPCPRCPQSFVSVYYLADHVKLKHPDYTVAGQQASTEQASEPQSTNKPDDAERLPPQPPPDNEDSSSNDISDFDFDGDLDDLQEDEFHHETDEHENSANGFECDRCGQEFTKSSSLRRHVACVHDRRKPFACRICTRKFARNCALRKHISRKHKDSSSATAEASTDNREDVELMDRASHDDDDNNDNDDIIIKTEFEQPLNFHVAKFSCQLCDKDYALPGSLRRHVRSVHEGHAPYRCDQCPMAFTRNSFLRYHLKQKHAKPVVAVGQQLHAFGVSKKPSDVSTARKPSTDGHN